MKTFQSVSKSAVSDNLVMSITNSNKSINTSLMLSKTDILFMIKHGHDLDFIVNHFIYTVTRSFIGTIAQNIANVLTCVDDNDLYNAITDYSKMMNNDQINIMTEDEHDLLVTNIKSIIGEFLTEKEIKLAKDGTTKQD